MRIYSDSIQLQNAAKKSSVHQRQFLPLNGRLQNSSITAAGSSITQSSPGASAFNRLLDNLRNSRTGQEQSTEAAGTAISSSQSQEDLKKQVKELEEACNSFECILTSNMLNNALENGAIKGYINVGTGEQIFREMLNEKTVEESAKSGAYGIGRILFNQLIKRLVPGV